MDREKIIRHFHEQINRIGHIIGAAVGSGLTAKLSALGGADILLVLSHGFGQARNFSDCPRCSVALWIYGD